MMDIEILAELKNSYEYLADIRENGCEDHCAGQLNEENTTKIEIAMNEISEVYESFRTVMSDDECTVKINGETYIIGHTINEDYNVPNEDVSITCADLYYYWYKEVEKCHKMN